jgi:hypothetical protein
MMFSRRVLITVACVAVAVFAVSNLLLQYTDRGFLHMVGNICWLGFWLLAFFLVVQAIAAVVGFPLRRYAQARVKRLVSAAESEADNQSDTTTGDSSYHE